VVDPGQQVADQAQRLELDTLVVLAALDPGLRVADAQAGVQPRLPVAEDDLLLSPGVSRDAGAVPLLAAVRRGVKPAGRVVRVDVDDHRLPLSVWYAAPALASRGAAYGASDRAKPAASSSRRA